jgi:hypothetical protein
LQAGLVAMAFSFIGSIGLYCVRRWGLCLFGTIAVVGIALSFFGEPILLDASIETLLKATNVLTGIIIATGVFGGIFSNPYEPDGSDDTPR